MSLEYLHIRGFRSLSDVRLRLSPLTVICGANGTGKSNLYRSLHLVTAAARGQLARTLIDEGGMPSVLWSGPRRSSNRRPPRAAFSIELRSPQYGYRLECGLPVPDDNTLFKRDPEMKTERAWLGPIDRAAARFLTRDRASARLRDATEGWHDFPGILAPNESLLAQIHDPHRYPDLEGLRTLFAQWRFYHHFRTDPESPLRQPRQGTRTPSLAGDGSDLAAALRTVFEFGDAAALARAIDRLQPGAQLEITEEKGWFDLLLHTPGLHRPLHGRELSDGTLRYLALAAALFSPHPAPLLAFNEPETSLHPSLLPALADLFVHASRRSQVWVTTHSDILAEALEAASAAPVIRLQLKDGATQVVGQGLIFATDDDEQDEVTEN